MAAIWLLLSFITLSEAIDCSTSAGGTVIGCLGTNRRFEHSVATGTWNSAFDTCKSRGGILAHFETLDLLSALGTARANLNLPTSDAWIGAKSLASTWADWIWVDSKDATAGTAVIDSFPTFTSYGGENDAGHETVFLRMSYNPPHFADWSYTASVAAFICEYGSCSTPAAGTLLGCLESGRRFEGMSGASITWNGAFDICTSHGGKLAHVDTLDIYNQIVAAKNVGKIPAVAHWIGAKFLSTSPSDHIWVESKDATSGTAFSVRFPEFASYVNDNDNSDETVIFRLSKSPPKFGDWDYFGTLANYLCEYSTGVSLEQQPTTTTTNSMTTTTGCEVNAAFCSSSAGGTTLGCLGTDRRFEITHTSGTWYNAFDTCVSRGGTLAKFETLELLTALGTAKTNLGLTNNYVWTGAKHFTTAWSDWIWVDNKDATTGTPIINNFPTFPSYTDENSAGDPLVVFNMGYSPPHFVDCRDSCSLDGFACEFVTCPATTTTGSSSTSTTSTTSTTTTTSTTSSTATSTTTTTSTTLTSTSTPTTPTSTSTSTTSSSTTTSTTSTSTSTSTTSTTSTSTTTSTTSSITTSTTTATSTTSTLPYSTTSTATSSTTSTTTKTSTVLSTISAISATTGCEASAVFCSSSAGGTSLGCLGTSNRRFEHSVSSGTYYNAWDTCVARGGKLAHLETVDLLTTLETVKTNSGISSTYAWVGAKALSTAWTDWIWVESKDDTTGLQITNNIPTSYISQNAPGEETVLVRLTASPLLFLDAIYTTVIDSYICEFRSCLIFKTTTTTVSSTTSMETTTTTMTVTSTATYSAASAMTTTTGCDTSPAFCSASAGGISLGCLGTTNRRFEFTQTSGTWYNAFDTCVARGGKLAKFETLELLTALGTAKTNLGLSSTNLWIGAIHSTTTWTDWIWVENRDDITGVPIVNNLPNFTYYNVENQASDPAALLKMTYAIPQFGDCPYSCPLDSFACEFKICAEAITTARSSTTAMGTTTSTVSAMTTTGCGEATSAFCSSSAGGTSLGCLGTTNRRFEFSSTAGTWYNAFDTCVARGGKLAKFETLELLTALGTAKTNLGLSSTNLWIRAKHFTLTWADWIWVEQRDDINGTPIINNFPTFSSYNQENELNSPAVILKMANSPPKFADCSYACSLDSFACEFDTCAGILTTSAISTTTTTSTTISTSTISFAMTATTITTCEVSSDFCSSSAGGVSLGCLGSGDRRFEHSAIAGTWNAAFDTCVARGGILAHFETLELFSALGTARANLGLPTSDAWIGAKSLASTWADWIWVDSKDATAGTAVINYFPTFTSYGGENDVGHETVFLRMSYNPPYFADWDYTSSVQAFICEYGSCSTPPAIWTTSTSSIPTSTYISSITSTSTTSTVFSTTSLTSSSTSTTTSTTSSSTATSSSTSTITSTTTSTTTSTSSASTTITTSTSISLTTSTSSTTSSTTTTTTSTSSTTSTTSTTTSTSTASTTASTSITTTSTTNTTSSTSTTTTSSTSTTTTSTTSTSTSTSTTSTSNSTSTTLTSTSTSTTLTSTSTSTTSTSTTTSTTSTSTSTSTTSSSTTTSTTSTSTSTSTTSSSTTTSTTSTSTTTLTTSTSTSTSTTSTSTTSTSTRTSTTSTSTSTSTTSTSTTSTSTRTSTTSTSTSTSTTSSSTTTTTSTSTSTSTTSSSTTTTTPTSTSTSTTSTSTSTSTTSTSTSTSTTSSSTTTSTTSTSTSTPTTPTSTSTSTTSSSTSTSTTSSSTSTSTTSSSTSTSTTSSSTTTSTTSTSTSTSTTSTSTSTSTTSTTTTTLTTSTTITTSTTSTSTTTSTTSTTITSTTLTSTKTTALPILTSTTTSTTSSSTSTTTSSSFFSTTLTTTTTTLFESSTTTSDQTTSETVSTTTLTTTEPEVNLPTDCWDRWGPWSECSVTCETLKDSGSHTRRRTGKDGRKCDSGQSSQQKNCWEIGTRPCPIDCKWANWAKFSSCSSTCGNGTMIRKRKYGMTARFGGKDCQGTDTEEAPCVAMVEICPKPGEKPKLPPKVEAVLTQSGIDEDVAGDAIALSATVTTSMAFMVDAIKDEVKMEMGHKPIETLPMCQYDGTACDIEEDFLTRYDSALGNCFTFNHFNPPKYKASRAGEQYGLSILLQGSQEDYLCTTQVAGFKVLIHNFTEQPFPDTLGYYISPGTTNSIAMTQRTIQRLPPPYGTCQLYPDMERYYFNGSYTVEVRTFMIIEVFLFF